MYKFLSREKRVRNNESKKKIKAIELPYSVKVSTQEFDSCNIGSIPIRAVRTTFIFVVRNDTLGVNSKQNIYLRKGVKQMEEKNMRTEETKHEVTNEQILEHLKEIEIAQGCITNGINTLFSVIIERKEQLNLSKCEAEMIRQGEVALACITNRMADISGMNEKLNECEKESQAKVHVVSKEDVKDFVDFLKEILS